MPGVSVDRRVIVMLIVTKETAYLCGFLATVTVMTLVTVVCGGPPKVAATSSIGDGTSQRIPPIFSLAHVPPASGTVTSVTTVTTFGG
jgi:hypothetical protein